MGGGVTHMDIEQTKQTLTEQVPSHTHAHTQTTTAHINKHKTTLKRLISWCSLYVQKGFNMNKSSSMTRNMFVKRLFSIFVQSVVKCSFNYSTMYTHPHCRPHKHSANPAVHWEKIFGLLSEVWKSKINPASSFKKKIYKSFVYRSANITGLG